MNLVLVVLLVVCVLIYFVNTVQFWRVVKKDEGHEASEELMRKSKQFYRWSIGLGIAVLVIFVVWLVAHFVR